MSQSLVRYLPTCPDDGQVALVDKDGTAHQIVVLGPIGGRIPSVFVLTVPWSTVTFVSRGGVWWVTSGF